MTTRCAARRGAPPAPRSTRPGIRHRQRAKRSRSPTSWRSGRWRRICWTDFRRACRAVFVQVQNGCDHRCTFCIIPYGRGNSRSVPMGAVVDQVRALVERGHAEIVLTGVDLTSYGADLPGAPKLGQLTKQILRHVPELKRLRISSIDQVEVDRDLLDVIADDERADAASASVAAVRRRSDPEAHEAAAFARRRDCVLRAGAAAAAGYRVRRRYHRRLPDRDRGHVRALAGSGRGVRSDVSACVSLFAAPGHAGGANAAGAGRRHQASAQSGYGQRARRPCSSGSISEIGATRQVLIESATQGRTEHFLPVAIAGESAGAQCRALTISRDMMARD